MKHRLPLVGLVALVSMAAVAAVGTAGAVSGGDRHGRSYEVWLIDQEDKANPGVGTLHVFDGEQLADDADRADPESIDLGGAVRALCEAETGSTPSRPHMLVFNGGDDDGPGDSGGAGGAEDEMDGEEDRADRDGDGARGAEDEVDGDEDRADRDGDGAGGDEDWADRDGDGARADEPARAGNTHAVIAYVASGHVAFLDAASREPVGCVDVGAQAHAAWPTPDQRHLIVANQNGKLLNRIATDYENEVFTLEGAATLNLATCTTPSGAACQDPALRPDNAPICPRTTSDGAFTFVTLRGGGMFVVDHNTTPMRIVAEYTREHVDDNGCGEMEVRGKMYVNSGAGLTVPSAPGDEPYGHDVYAVDLSRLSTTPATTPNTPPARLVYSRDGTGAEVDAHAVALTRRGRYLWWGDRTQNDVTVVDPRRDRVVARFGLANRHSDDPAPDLFDLSPRGDFMFASLRGPNPSSGHDAYGSTPGVGVIEVRRGGRRGRLVGVARVGSVRGTPDPHAIRVRNLGGR